MMTTIDLPTDFEVVKGRRKNDPESVNLPCSFDIETSSFYFNPKTGETISVPEFFARQDANPKSVKRFEKRGCLVAWGVGINGEIAFGRTWRDLLDFFSLLSKHFELNPEKRILPIYVHNLSYEFQWIRKRMNWESVFAVSERQPIRCLSNYGIEFRDSLILSGMSLEKTAENLVSHTIDKLVGSWDYHALRGSETAISAQEWKYLENDNKIVCYYVAEMMDQYKNVNRIPMTKTGIVREDVRSYCFYGDRKSHKRDNNHRYERYISLIHNLKFTSLNEYYLARWAFAGGFTHANPINAGLIIHKVRSMDISSSYPTILCSEYFPMGTGRLVKPKSFEEFKKYLRTYACLMEITFEDIESTFPYDHIISRSKCIDVVNAEIDNGRIIRAKRIRTAITEIDFESFSYFYKWKSIEVHQMYIYTKAYLPKPIVEKCIEYYEGKTSLKEVEGKEVEYARLKTMINAMFGMCVYDELKDEIIYKGDEWSTEKVDKSEQLDKYNNSKTRFLSYLWGVWITAYARRNLFSAIKESGSDHQYSDTDSEKLTNFTKHEHWFKSYNAFVTKKIRKCLQYHNIDPDRASPKDVNGIAHPLGVFAFDGDYARFCTLGAKRYAIDKGEQYPDEKRYSLTISGVNKKKAIPEIIKRMKDQKKDFFDFFKFGISYDRDTCGKLLHTYIDEKTSGDFIDKDGKLNHYEEESFVHLEETTYEMTADDEYFSLLNKYNSISYLD